MRTASSRGSTTNVGPACTSSCTSVRTLQIDVRLLLSVISVPTEATLGSSLVSQTTFSFHVADENVILVPYNSGTASSSSFPLFSLFRLFSNLFCAHRSLYAQQQTRNSGDTWRKRLIRWVCPMVCFVGCSPASRIQFSGTPARRKKNLQNAA